ncbi:uncharacterized protein LOC125500006 [Athalia rosae]|uniref:uncharacterized protein LOC125500006 n=1 Tax=Athalia rosae TaxID=37344 RepID=UPI002033F235|nr:uncharacterized protein LOC125500006 [Athalia rosae]
MGNADETIQQHEAHDKSESLAETPSIPKESGPALRQMLDHAQKLSRSLKILKANTWDAVFTYHIVSKMDNTTKREWKCFTKDIDMPTEAQLIEFLEERCAIVDTDVAAKPAIKLNSSGNVRQSNSRRDNTSFTGVSTDSSTCKVCENFHEVYRCPVFRNLSVASRTTVVKRHKLFMNCLRLHNGKCTFGRCRKCNRFHNTLLHMDSDQHTLNAKESSAPTPDPEHPRSSGNNVQKMRPSDGASTSQSTAPFTGAVGTAKSQVLLSTALIFVEDRYGKLHECRALLDSGSQSNLMTRELGDRLSLPRERFNLPIGGINNTSTKVHERVQLTIRSRQHAYKSTLSVLVIDEIVTQHPATWIDAKLLRIPENLTLADPTFNRPGRIDLLIGASIFWELICAGQIKLTDGQPIMQKTQLGWIISGEVAVAHHKKNQTHQFCGFVTDEQISDQLHRFWKLEECNGRSHYTREERACEEHFQQTHFRKNDGRFIVQLPLRRDFSQLGDSKQTAIKRFHAVERKLSRQPHLKAQYIKFMDEYESLNHMTAISDSLPAVQHVYYIPHHAVLKEDSLTTKLRVVFDGSCKTTAGTSLNDILLVGPTIQQDLFSIILRFRQHKYVFTADIEKMYRQIIIHKDQRDLQRIVWRRSPEEPLRTFQLNTVTYGLASSPFLAIRCLQQLALENRDRFPDSTRIIEEDFYVDDLITGADTLEEVSRIKGEVTTVLQLAKFKLYKWAANDETLRNNINNDITMATRSIGDDVKTLGLRWNPLRDELQYHVQVPDASKRVTKRTILSTIAQIFDPLGLIGPTTIRAKIILQRLWLSKISWDESVPLDIHTMWTQYVGQLHRLQHIKIPRLVKTPSPDTIELHGFCDDSEAAYGACLYIRSHTQNGTWTSRLLCAKSKVAPIKNVSLPRLELCGALLLAQLSHKATRALRMNIDRSYFWSDSTITLAWIKGEPCQWKTFVANRVSEIQNLTDSHAWRHVKSEDNPADVISRGIDPQLLEGTTAWWQGPTWLSEGPEHWPQPQMSQPTDIPETRQQSVVFLNIDRDFEIFDKFSSLSRFKRVVAYCIRFKHNTLNRNNRRCGPLTVIELNTALSLLIRLMQRQEFPNERKSLKLNQGLSNNSKLLTLHPFLDKDGIIRVGGRLRNSRLPEGQRHPIILSAKHKLTKLIIRDEHYRHLHTGAQALLASLRTRYWPLAGKNTIRSVLRHCIVCFKNRPNTLNQMMGDLPDARVNPARAFLKCGVDYAGPFSIKISRNKTGKAYLCLFVCLTTKAIHLEVAVDLSTTGFLNAFKRFIARRGRPSDMYSDNGTNFVGANNELKELRSLLQDEQNRATITNYFAQESINWHFNPPNSPHFGGLWEAGVKSVKTHLRKIIGNALLTFEELYTTFSLIEACLNSRPLTPISNDPDDLIPLTPGHFLIGEPLTALPQPDLLDVPLNRLTRYQRITQLKQHFWSRSIAMESGVSVEFTAAFKMDGGTKNETSTGCDGDFER